MTRDDVKKDYEKLLNINAVREFFKKNEVENVSVYFDADQVVECELKGLNFNLFFVDETNNNGCHLQVSPMWAKNPSIVNYHLTIMLENIIWNRSQDPTVPKTKYTSKEETFLSRTDTSKFISIKI